MSTRDYAINYEDVEAGRIGFWESPRWRYPAYLLFFLMLFAPTAYKSVKVVVLVAVVLIIAGAILRRDGRLGVHPSVVGWTWFYTALGIFYSILGVVRGHPGALAVTTVYVLWPWLYLLYISGGSREEVVRVLVRTLVVALVAINLFIIHYLLYELGFWPSELYLNLALDQTIGMYEGFVQFRVLSLDSLIFLIPFAVGALLTWPNREGTESGEFDAPVRRVWLWVGLALGTALVLVSGRRALMLVFALSPIIAIAFRSLLPGTGLQLNKKRAVVFLAVLAAVIGGAFWVLEAAYDITLIALLDLFFSAFDNRLDLGASIRTQQLRDLLVAWTDNPLLGTGFGANVDAVRGAAVVGMTSIDETSWSYELQYVALLVHTGVIGVLAYTAGMIWIYLRSVEVIRRGAALGYYLAPIMVGVTCFLIASATNPYLGKYDFLWTIFLPVLIINIHLLERDGS